MAVILGGNGVGLAARALDAGACRTENSTSNPPMEVWRWRKCSLCTDIFYLTVCLIDGLQFNASWSAEVTWLVQMWRSLRHRPARPGSESLACDYSFITASSQKVEKTRISTIRASAMSH